jgi:hypothetical protein
MVHSFCRTRLEQSASRVGAGEEQLFF